MILDKGARKYFPCQAKNGDNLYQLLLITQIIFSGAQSSCSLLHNQSSLSNKHDFVYLYALDLKSPLERGGDRLRWGCVLFEVRLEANVLFETERCIHSSRYLVVIHMYAPASNNEQRTDALSELFQSSSSSRLQEPTPSATTWPSSLEGGLKIRIIRSQSQHSRKDKHIRGI